MNEQYLIEILTEINTESCSLEANFIPILAKNLLLETEQRPLPNANHLRRNPEAANRLKEILKEILTNSHEQYTENQFSKFDIISLLTSVSTYFTLVRGKSMANREDQSFKKIISEFEEEFAPLNSELLIDKDGKKEFNPLNRQLLMDNDGQSVCELLDAIFEKDENRINKENIDNLICRIDELQEKIILPMKTDLIDKELSLKLMEISLRIHSEQFFKEFTDKTGPYHIIHFYESPSSPISTTAMERNVFGSPRASEFSCGYDSDVSDHDSISLITNITHGIGSGIYGRMRLSEVDINNAKNTYKSNFKIITITDPLILDDTNSIRSSITSKTAFPPARGFNEEQRKNSNITDNQTSNSKQGYKLCDFGGDDFWLGAFGISQKEVSKLLMNSLSHEVNNLLQPVVKEALLTEEFSNFLVKKELITQNISCKDIKEKLSDYSQMIEIIKAYIDFDFNEKNDTRRKHSAAVLQALAHIKSIELYIWERSNFEDGRLQPHKVCECEYNTVGDKDSAPQKRNYHVYKPNQPQQRLDFISCGVLLTKIQLVGFSNVTLPRIPNDDVICEIEQEEHHDYVDIKVESAVYTEISNELQKIAQMAKEQQIAAKSTNKITREAALGKIENIDEKIENIANRLSQFSAIKSQRPKVEINVLKHMVKRSLINFLRQARQDIVKMPINFLIQDELKFDGVICEQFDTFRNGLVAFSFEPEIVRSPSPHAYRSCSFFDRSPKSKSNSYHRDNSSSSSNSPYGGPRTTSE